MTDALPAHSPLGGSGASRWMECPAAGKLAKILPSKPGSAHAEEGTLAHEAAAEWLETGEAPLHLPDDIFDNIKIYVEHVQRLADRSDDTVLMIEEKFRLHHIEPDDTPMFGSADAAIVIPSKRWLHVVDYKHGIGIPVAVYDNQQLLYYALGVWYKLGRRNIDHITMWIVQPRCMSNRSGPINHWTITIEDLKVFEENLIRSIDKIMSEATEFNPGSHCRWCPAAGSCKAQTIHVLKAVGVKYANGEFDLPDLEDTVLTDKQLAKIYLALAPLKQWIARVEEEAMARYDRKGTMPGLKLVAGRRRRLWDADMDEVLEEVQNVTGLPMVEVVKSSAVSPAQLEKLVTKETMEALSHLITWTEGEPRLAGLEDPRPEIDRPRIEQDAMKGLNENG